MVHLPFLARARNKDVVVVDDDDDDDGDDVDDDDSIIFSFDLQMKAVFGGELKSCEVDFIQ